MNFRRNNKGQDESSGGRPDFIEDHMNQGTIHIFSHLIFRNSIEDQCFELECSFNQANDNEHQADDGR